MRAAGLRGASCGEGGKSPPEPLAAASGAPATLWVLGTAAGAVASHRAPSPPAGRGPVGRVKVLPRRTQARVRVRGVAQLLFETEFFGVFFGFAPRFVAFPGRTAGRGPRRGGSRPADPQGCPVHGCPGTPRAGCGGALVPRAPADAGLGAGRSLSFAEVCP